MKRAGLITIGCVILSLLVAVSGAFTWSPLNCWNDEIDIRSGRIRHTRFLLYCQISEWEEASPISAVLGKNGSTGGDGPDWHCVNTLSPWVHHSPHYTYHNAINQAYELELVWQMIPMTDEAKRRVAVNVLTLWQRDGDYFSAGRYVEAVGDIALTPNPKGSRGVDVKDLPPLPAPLSK